MIHHLWTPAGRLLHHGGRQYRYASQLGQRNVVVGASFAPYHWNPVTGILRYGDMEIQVNGAGVEFRQGQKTMRTAFHLEERRGASWAKNDMGVAGVDVESVDTLGAVAKAKINIRLQSDENESVISVLAGCNSWARFVYDLKAKRSGRHRIGWDFESDPGQVLAYPKKTGEILPATQYALPAGFRLGWLPEELPDHQFAMEGGMVAAKLLERDLARNASVSLSPTTFGPSIPAAGSDDVQGDALGYAEDGFGGGRLIIDDRDNSGGWYTVGARFEAVDLLGVPTAINAATITCERDDDNRADAFNNILVDVEASNTPATFSSGSRPYARTVRNVARVTHEFPDSASTEVPNVAPLISDLIGAAGYTYTGDPTHAINFIFGAEQQYGNPDPVTRCIGYDTSHASGDPVELAIDFTASGGGPTPAAGFRSLLGVGR